MKRFYQTQCSACGQYWVSESLLCPIKCRKCGCYGTVEIDGETPFSRARRVSCAIVYIVIAIWIILSILGCTRLDYKGIHYSSFLTDKSLKSAVIIIDPNGKASADLRGYDSATSEIAGQIAEGFARGMK